MKRIISPSLLSADFSDLKSQIDIVKNAGADRLHIDCMDGHFVPNFTFGPFIVKAIRKLTDLHLETHLMIDNPANYFDDFINAGSDILIFHYEASNNSTSRNDGKKKFNFKKRKNRFKIRSRPKAFKFKKFRKNRN